ncbi:MAG: response regulator [Bacteroidales bacterium]
MKRILVIDDDPIMRETIRDILEFENFSVCEAKDGRDGMSCLQKEQFDMIVTDVLMPEKDGIEVIIEAKKKQPQIQIVAVSGGGYISAENYLKMASDLGASAIVVKPFDIDMFIDKVNSLLYGKMLEL